MRPTLESLIPLAADSAAVLVVAAAAAPHQVLEAIASPPLPYRVIFFAAPHLHILQDFLLAHGQGNGLMPFSLYGYAQMRNLMLILANILEAEILVSLDDDVRVADADFLAKVEENFALLSPDHPRFGLAGIYQNPDGSVLLPEPTAAWTVPWPKIRWMNDAFKELFLSGPRLKPTPLALGGNLALTADLFRQLPFDPGIARGEDIDYVLNARMFKIPFFLDNTLKVIHQPGDKPYPLWVQLRQDLQRFCYTRRKLSDQKPEPGMTLITPDELKPYPGNFLQADLESRAYQSHHLLAQEYQAKGEAQAARHTLENLAWISRVNNTRKNVFQTYLDLVHGWQALQAWLAQPRIAAAARQALWGIP
ncbi:MAG: hypothetical protein ACLFUU_07820 [Desulfobacteraceae bacterium]